MAADRPGPDPKALWRDQEQEADPVTLDQIHAMVRRYDGRTRRAILAFPIILMAAAFVSGQLWMKTLDPLGHVLAIVTIAGEAATAYIVWRMLYPARDPAEPAGAYLHRRLLRRLAYLKGRWMIAAAPLIPALVLAQYYALTHGHRPWPARVAPLVILIAAMAFIRWRVRGRRRRIEVQIDELEGLMRR
jgi:hypothetical protein